ncbi:MAG: sigma-70 family RNA polymerase sigma factor [Limisphaerales bacterium]
MTNSRALLVDYAENGTESAFRDLVARYIDLVYSTALRQAGGDAHLAQDVAQTVFLHLARKARSLPQGVMLGGWLHQAACNVAATVMRTERRRQVRERQAVQMNTLQNDPAGTFDHVAPFLDDAIRQLPEDDRTAVLLRFFEKRDFRSVGDALGSSEDAARMRVNRALEKLEVLLRQRGVTISATALGTALAADAVTAAPAGLAASVAGTALAGVAAAGAATLSVFKIMAISKIQMGALSAILIGGMTTALVVQHRSLAPVLDAHRSLQQEVQDLRDAKDQLARAQVDRNELERLRRGHSELLRLRGEVAVLRRASNAASRQTGPGDQGTPESSATPEASPGAARLQASVRAQVGAGQTLLTGGWSNEPGKRIFLLSTPLIQGDNADQVQITTKVIEVADAALAKVGLDAFTVEGGESSVKQVLRGDQAEELVRVLRETDGVDLLSEPRITTLDGRQAEIRVIPEGTGAAGQGWGCAINVVPVISGDKTAVDITLQARINRPAPQAQ